VANPSLSVSGPMSVTLEVPVPPLHTVSGSVTRNGAQPVVTSCSYVSFQGMNQYIAATLSFTHATDSRFDAVWVVPCSNSSTTNWTFSAQLYPGTYSVTVKKSGQSNLPSWDTVANPSLSVSGPMSVTLEVPVPPLHTVSGSVTRNGAQPVVTSCGYVSFQGMNQYIAAILTFTHLTDARFSSTAVVPCSSSSATNWTYSTQLYPGTYSVTVKKSGQSNLPAWDTVAVERLQVP
jgi:hypothetical protein